MTDLFFSRILPLSLAGSLVAVALLLLLPVTRRHFSRRWQFYSYAVALAMFCVPVSLPRGAHTVIPVVPFAQLPPIELASAALDAPMPAAPLITWRGVIAALWAAGAIVFLLHSAWAALRFHRLLAARSSDVSDTRLLRVFERCKAEKNIRRRIRLALCPQIGSPMLTGILRPVILLPNLTLTDEQARLVLLHELTHYRHGDLVYKLAALLVNVIHWHSPLAWIVRRKLNPLCEQACDEALARAMDSDQRRGYAVAILDVMGDARILPPVSTSFSLTRDDLKRRLIFIMECRKSTKAVVAAGMCAIVLIGAAGMSVSSYLFGGDGVSAADRKLTSTLAAAEPKAAELDGNRKLVASGAQESDAELSADMKDAIAISDEFAKTAVPGSLAYPVEGAKISVGYMGYYGHTGVDFLDGGIEGRDIHAARDGTVTASGVSGAYGKRVILDHGDGVQTVYTQCDSLTVKEGDKVKQGDTIATVGMTGNVTGPHLHFELRVNGVPVDPTPCFPAK